MVTEGSPSKGAAGLQETDKLLSVNRPKPEKPRVVGLCSLISFIFFNVSGGPYASEPVVKAGGPLLAMVCICLMPFIWSIPEAMVTAELATAMPEDGGFVLWVMKAAGAREGFHTGWWAWISLVLDAVLYPGLILKFATFDAPLPEIEKYLLKVLMVVLLMLVAYRGLQVSGRTAAVLTVVSLSPFVPLVGLGLVHAKPSNWLEVLPPAEQDWSLMIHVLFWNFHSFDCVATFAGNIHDPQRNYPVGLSLSAGLVSSIYLFSILAGTGVSHAWSEWDEGYFTVVANQLGGATLGVWILMGAAASSAGHFLADITTSTYLLSGCAEQGVVPSILARTSKYNTPYIVLALTFGIQLIVLNLSFMSLLKVNNCLEAFSKSAQYFSFLWLKRYAPDMERPFRCPGGYTGAVLLVTPSFVLLLVMVYLSDWQTLMLTGLIMLLGVGLEVVFSICRKHNWCHFESTAPAKMFRATLPEQRGSPMMTPAPA